MTLRNKVTKGHSSYMDTEAWFTYILQCADGFYYVGITNDLDLRLTAHNNGQAARWTAQRRPVELRYAESHPTKSAARKREIEIKGWRRDKKIGLFESLSNIAFQYREAGAHRRESGATA